MILAWLTFTGKRYYQRPGYVQRNKTLSPARCDWLVNEITWRMEALRGTEFAVQDEYALFWVVRQSCNPSKTSTAMPTTTSAPMVTRTYVRGTCIQRQRNGRCRNRLNDQYVRFNWLGAASRYVESFTSDLPDTCRYAGQEYRCTVPLNGQFATLLRVMQIFDIDTRMVLVDRGPYGVHLDLRLRRLSVLDLIEVLRSNTPGVITSMINNRVRQIEDSIEVELRRKKPPYTVHHVDPREVIRGIMSSIATEDAFYTSELYPSRQYPMSDTRLLDPLNETFMAGIGNASETSGIGARMSEVQKFVSNRAHADYEQLQRMENMSSVPMRLSETAGHNASIKIAYQIGAGLSRIKNYLRKVFAKIKQ